MITRLKLLIFSFKISSLENRHIPPSNLLSYVSGRISLFFSGFSIPLALFFVILIDDLMIFLCLPRKPRHNNIIFYKI